MSENDQTQGTENDSQLETYRKSEPEQTAGRSNMPLVLGIVALLAVILIGVSAFMLFGRQPETVASPSNTTTTNDGAIASDTDQSAAAESISSAQSEPAASAVDLNTLPQGLTAAGDVLSINGGQVQLPAALQPTDDVYLWDGQGWGFLPTSMSADGQLLSVGTELDGREVVVARRALNETVVVAGEAGTTALPEQYIAQLGEITVSQVNLGPEGTLTGEVAPLQAGSAQQLLHVTNVSAIIDQTALTELLNDQNLQAVHVQSIVNTVNSANFAGVNLDYQGVFDAQEGAYTQFIATLADALEAANKSLYVTLATPTANSGFAWRSEGQNWEAIGQLADGVYFMMPLDPSVYGNGGQADTLLAWATRQIDRDKLVAVVSTNAIDRFGGAYREMPLADALNNLGTLQLNAENGVLDPGSTVEATLAGEATPLAWEGESLTYKFTYTQNGEPRTVWINNNASLANRLQLVRKYGLRGASIRGLAESGNVDGYLAAINSYQTGGQIPEPAGAAITWTVFNSEGGVVASDAGDMLNYSWSGSDISGEFMLKAEFVQGDVQLPLDETTLMVGDVPQVAEADTEERATEEEVAVETTEEETAEEAATEEVAEEAAPAEEAAETPLEFTGDANGRINVLSNVRAGPGIIYAIAGSAEPGDQVQLIGRSTDTLWYEFVKLADESTGWIYGPLVDVQPGFDTNGLPVSAVAAAPIVVAPAAGGGDSGGGDSGGGQPAAAAPAPVAAANLGGGFELGGQTHTLANPLLMKESGMTWVKFQHKWGCGNNPSDVQGRIDSARANGFKVLLSIPGSPYPSSIDFQCYVDFLGGVAALGPDAIEVWNEMNIDFEWPVGQISANQYVTQMLAPAYNAIKSANPNVLVISGAPAPTGFFGGGCGATGCDDDAYLREMQAAGAAQYMDCMGVHYNAGATSPNQSSGHPADGGDGHYSWYFQPMINVYSILGKPLCFTELGYLSGQDYGGVPGRFSWAGNTTVAQHAQWMGEAVSIAANSGRVRMLIIFNVDFTLYADDPQAGFALRRKDGSCPGCGVLKSVMGQ